jgi:hypothetical protein
MFGIGACLFGLTHGQALMVNAMTQPILMIKTAEGAPISR